MWWGLSAEWWMQLWSGVIGTIAAAVISVFVALLVVNRTNAHQSALSAHALKQQKERDDKALEVQRAALQEQLNEQRREASRLRMMDIRTDVNVATANLVDASYAGPDAIDRALEDVRRGFTRWRIESEDEVLIAELMWWPDFLAILARERYVAKVQGDAASRKATWNRLNNAVSMMSVVSVHLPRPNYVPPEKAHEMLRETRAKANAEREAQRNAAGDNKGTPPT